MTQKTECIHNFEGCDCRNTTLAHIALTDEEKVQGATHPMAKLNDADVRSIFRLRQKGLTHKEIASRFGVHRVGIGKILSGQTWKSVGGNIND